MLALTTQIPFGSKSINLVNTRFANCLAFFLYTMRKILSLILFCGLFSATSFSQLDSVSVTVSFSLEVDSTFMDSISVPTDFMTVQVWVNDPMLVGNVLISVYESQSGHPMARINSNTAALQTINPLGGNTFSIPIGFLDSSLGYGVRVLVQNFQLAYLPEIIISYP